METMTPAMERLVRLMLLIPHDSEHPIWKSMMDDCGDITEVMAMRWFVGDTVKMWPEAGPRNLACAVLTVFDTPSETTLRHLSSALLYNVLEDKQRTGPGAAWVAEAKATAIRVLADSFHPEQVEHEVKEHWTLSQK